MKGVGDKKIQFCILYGELMTEMYLEGARGLTILPKINAALLGLVSKFLHSRLEEL